MENIDDPKSAIDTVIEAFNADFETERTESTLRELIRTYPDNQDIRHILVKVVAINTLYHARVLDVDIHPLAIHIASIEGLDEMLRKDRLTPSMQSGVRGERGRNTSLCAYSKYCSWHNQDAYAIYDGNVWQALVEYRSRKRGFTFKDAEAKNCEGFRAIVKRFQSHYGLELLMKEALERISLGGRRWPHCEAEEGSARDSNAG